MSIIMTPEETGGTHLPPGTYVVTCMDVTEDVLENPQYGGGQVIRFELEVADVCDDDGNLVKLDPIANKKLTPKSKLWTWLEAFGLHPEIGKPIDLDSVVGLQAQAVVGEKPGKDGTGSFATVDGLVPMPTSRPLPVGVEELSISDWWAEVRRRNHGMAIAVAKSKELFGAEPKNISAAQRAEILAHL